MASYIRQSKQGLSCGNGMDVNSMPPRVTPRKGHETADAGDGGLGAAGGRGGKGDAHNSKKDDTGSMSNVNDDLQKGEDDALKEGTTVAEFLAKRTATKNKVQTTLGSKSSGTGTSWAKCTKQGTKTTTMWL